MPLRCCPRRISTSPRDLAAPTGWGRLFGMSEDEPGRYHKFRTAQPPGWSWKDIGPAGPSWYPPVQRGAVDRSGEHLALCVAGPDREPGAELALVGEGEGAALFFEVLTEGVTTSEAIELLNDTCFEEVGDAPSFELAYEFHKKSQNRLYLDPFWVYHGE
jgi:hypothetical protein